MRLTNGVFHDVLADALPGRGGGNGHLADGWPLADARR
jgi:hypothetical protein